MKINIFLLFPEQDTDVLNAVTISNSFRNIPGYLHGITETARVCGIEYSFYYDSDNFRKFSNVVSILDDKFYLAKTIVQIKNIVRLKGHDIRHQLSLLNSIYSYSIWDSSIQSSIPNVHDLVKASGEGISIPDKSCLFSFVDKIPIDNEQISIIKDLATAHQDGLPCFLTLPLFFESNVCAAWISTFKVGFALENKQIFKETSYRWNNKRIYQKISDNSYWYFDFFHRDNKLHFEVFKSDGSYIGESDMDGNITLIKHNAKSISHIISGN
ncbi:MAG: hypothetical protein MJZ20_04925 [Bacteroidaceae bacterium]|nr:hypothetical protein [Bacteroidaceae bacterium]